MTLHQKFGPAEVNYLNQAMANFARDPYRTQATYPGTCYDIQLWCHLKDPLNNNTQHFHFSTRDRTQDGASSIKNLKNVVATAGGKFDYAHLVVRVGTEGVFRDDWHKIAREGYMIAESNTKRDGIFEHLDKNSARKMAPYFNDHGKLKTHITLARIEKRQADGSNIPFSSSEELKSLKQFYKKIAEPYNNPKNEKILIIHDTLRVTTQKNGKTEYLGHPQNLDLKIYTPNLQPSGFAERVEKVPGIMTITTDHNIHASYQAESNRFSVMPGKKISVPYNITVEQGGKISLGLLNTNKNGWYDEEVILGPGHYNSSPHSSLKCNT